MKQTRVMTRFVLALTLMSASLAYAYSYSAAGKEPVIDGREAILAGLAKNDYAAVDQAYGQLKEELEYLLKEHDIDLRATFDAAINARDSKAIQRELDRLVYQEIVRRLDSAQRHLEEYQVAKVLVVKSKLFLDLLTSKLKQAERQTAGQAISKLLESIGNPGLFGVGQKAPDTAMFENNRSILLEVLSQYH